MRSLVLRDEKDWAGALRRITKLRLCTGRSGTATRYARLQVDAADIELARSESGPETTLDLSVQAQVLAALEVLRKLGAQADVAKAEEVLVRASSQAAAGRRTDIRSARRPVLAVCLNLAMERIETESMEEQEALVVASQKLLEELTDWPSAESHNHDDRVRFIVPVP